MIDAYVEEETGVGCQKEEVNRGLREVMSLCCELVHQTKLKVPEPNNNSELKWTINAFST